MLSSPLLQIMAIEIGNQLDLIIWLTFRVVSSRFPLVQLISRSRLSLTMVSSLVPVLEMLFVRSRILLIGIPWFGFPLLSPNMLSLFGWPLRMLQLLVFVCCNGVSKVKLVVSFVSLLQKISPTCSSSVVLASVCGGNLQKSAVFLILLPIGKMFLLGVSNIRAKKPSMLLFATQFLVPPSTIFGEPVMR